MTVKFINNVTSELLLQVQDEHFVPNIDDVVNITQYGMGKGPNGLDLGEWRVVYRRISYSGVQSTAEVYITQKS